MASEKKAAKPRMPGELGFCLAMLLFSVTALALSYRISGFSSWSSAGSVPLGASLVMCVSALVIVFRELSKPAPELAPGETLARGFYEKIFPARHVVFVAVLVGYMALLEPLGFILSSFLYLMAASFVLGEKRLLRMFVSNVAALAGVYLVFQTAFSVVLPEGFVERMLR
ncbi:MAG: tripartite tricarboxylate transporter TctB family protein [Candidatus Accumulibacter sp.]|jgi:putative tricarboxylic transport membrane protein|nr:tripartite tricarboxylate transporter TctB family protein [Accumulibacter sp.]